MVINNFLKLGSWAHILGSAAIGFLIGYGVAHKLEILMKKKTMITLDHHSENCPRHQILESDLQNPPTCLCLQTKSEQELEDEMLLMKYLSKTA